MVTAIKKCFSPERVNTRRQPELDIAKGLAIIFMIWTHVFEELSPDTEGVLATFVRNIIGGPLAALSVAMIDGKPYFNGLVVKGKATSWAVHKMEHEHNTIHVRMKIFS